MYGRKVHQKLTGSGDWQERIVLAEHRYMREDVVLGLAFLVSVCEWAGVACPVARGLLELGSAVLGRSLRAGERTLEALGLAGLSRDAMRTLLQEGR
jgi:opine dehydrogenase